MSYVVGVGATCCSSTYYTYTVISKSVIFSFLLLNLCVSSPCMPPLLPARYHPLTVHYFNPTTPRAVRTVHFNPPFFDHFLFLWRCFCSRQFFCCPTIILVLSHRSIEPHISRLKTTTNTKHQLTPNL